MKQLWIYDLEQFRNFHSGTFKSVSTGEVRVFQIGVGKNDLEAYYKFLMTEVSGLIGFNNVNYDYPLLHFVLTSYQMFFVNNYPENEIASLMYDEGQRIINSEYSAIRAPLIPQLDLFRIWHFDNKARMMSLKAVEIALNMPNVQDLPYPFDHWVLNDQVQEILDYNLNDVNATEEFYNFSKAKIDLRRELTNTFNLPLMNANDPKIGEMIFAKLLSEELNIPMWELKKMRTSRSSIDLGEITLPYINFNTAALQRLKTSIESKTITETKDSLSYSVPYRNIMLQYGLGGLHACCKSGVYDSDDEYIIVDVDVKSFYPNIAIANDFYPEHLNGGFCKVYKQLYTKRATIPKSNPINAAYKLMLNGAYGKSNDVNSFFYDPKFTMSITVNGQLLLTMLIEAICDRIGQDIFIVQVNTDGATFRIKRSDYIKLQSACHEWEEITGLELEYANYKKMVIRDVNNYSAQYENGDIKHKGAFEIDKEIHKDHSMKVVRIATEKYYFEGIPIERTIREHDNVYDFCKRYKATKGWTPRYDQIINGNKVSKDLSKNVRYFVSNDGNSSLLKIKDTGKKVQVESGQSVREFNQYYACENYGIDFNYYIREADKLKNAVYDGQQTLF